MLGSQTDSPDVGHRLRRCPIRVYIPAHRTTYRQFSRFQRQMAAVQGLRKSSQPVRPAPSRFAYDRVTTSPSWTVEPISHAVGSKNAILVVRLDNRESGRRTGNGCSGVAPTVHR